MDTPKREGGFREEASLLLLFGDLFPCSGHNELLQDILRNPWKFDGYVTSDCWAVSDFAQYHKTYSNDTESEIITPYKSL